MKSILGIVLVAFLLVDCAPSYRRLPPVKSENIVDIAQQEEEYELLVFDPGFETWFTTTWSPAKDRSRAHYRFWNQRYVSAWNYKATRPSFSNIFDTTIQYDPTVDYGMEVDRKLYYYFRWVDTKKGIPILDTRQPSGAL